MFDRFLMQEGRSLQFRATEGGRRDGVETAGSSSSWHSTAPMMGAGIDTTKGFTCDGSGAALPHRPQAWQQPPLRRNAETASAS